VDQGRLGPILTRSNKAATLREMVLDVVLGRLDQSFVLQVLAIWVFARLVFPNPMLTDVASQKIHARLIPFQGVADARFVDIQRQAHPHQPYHQQLLTVVED
jgi:hypothetical protein